MPTVRSRRRPVVDALPTPRIANAAGDVPEAIARLGREIGQTGALLAQADAAKVAAEKKAAEEEKKKVNEGRLMGAYAKLGQVRLDTESLWKQQKGTEAIGTDSQGKGLIDSFTDEFSKQADAIRGELPEELHQQFDKMRLQEMEGWQRSAQSHFLEQSDLVRKQGYLGARATAGNEAARAVRPGGAVDEEEFTKARKAGEDAVKIWTRGWEPSAAEAEMLGFRTEMHEKVVEGLRSDPSAGADRAEAYLNYHAPEMDPDVVMKLRKELAPSALTSRAQAVVVGLETAHPKDPEARIKGAMAVQGELGQKVLQIQREREAMAEEAHADAQKKVIGTLMNGVSGGKIRSVSQLESNRAFTDALDDEGQVRVRDYLLAKQHQADRERRAATNHGASREQSRRDMEFTTWFARQPASTRLNLNVDEEAARRGASVTAANRAGMLQQVTHTNLPKMFDQQGFAKDATGWASAQWPGTSSQAKAKRTAFVDDLRAWHDTEVEAGRPVADKEIRAKAAELLMTVAIPGAIWDTKTTAEEAKRSGAQVFTPLPAEKQKHPLVKDVLGQGTTPAAPAAPVRVNTPAEALALPRGTRFITPDGKIKVRP